MTQNQIEYWKYMESKRHNIAEERKNMAAVEESRRHNVATEAQNQYALEENKRHNLEQELIGLEGVKASQASASAAMTSAAANYRNAVTREAELAQQKWVDSAVQTRQDLLAQSEMINRAAQTSKLEAEARLTDANTLLVTAKTLTETYQQGYLEAQTASAGANTIKQIVGTATGLITTIAALG